MAFNIDGNPALSVGSGFRRERNTPIAAGDTAERVPNTTPAIIERDRPSRFCTHLHTRLPNGDPLIAFEQNRGGADCRPIVPGMTVYASWPPDSGQSVRDERE
jgi:hypothetical protein